MPDTRERILIATIDNLWCHSYGSVSVEDICADARVQKGSFYHYFPSKVDVVIEAYEYYWRSNQPLFDTVFSPSLAPLDRLRGYCNTMYSKQKEQVEKFGKVLGCPYVACGSELSTQEERVRQKMDEIFTRSSRYFETLLRDAKAEGLVSAKNVAVLAQDMMSYIGGVMYQAKLKNDVEIIRRDLLPGLMRYFDLVPDRSVKTKVQKSVKEDA
jgi:TetR/AcrR family transcriptional regulator, transcriptional repressor for nem operon